MRNYKRPPLLLFSGVPPRPYQRYNTNTSVLDLKAMTHCALKRGHDDIITRHASLILLQMGHFWPFFVATTIAAIYLIVDS